MLKLILMRHAKSSWSDRKLDDFERPLSRRGKDAAPAMGRALAARSLVPARILCSPSRRTRDTLKLVLDAMAIRPPVSYDDQLYVFGDGTAYLNAIAKQGNASPLMLVGHNPSVQNLAQRLAGTGDAASFRKMKRKFPTAAAAVIALPFDSWSELQSLNGAPGELELFLTPRMLAQ
jgi:phosphohistidine phosphatase